MPLAKFDFLNTALNPFILMFVAIITGLLFGKIKFGKFSFGSSGALFSGLAIGWAAYRIAEKIYAGQDGAAAGMKAAAQIIEDNGGKVINSYFFTTCPVIFVASIGLLAAKDLGIVIKKYGPKFIVLAVLITFVGAGATYACTAFCKDTNAYAVTGVYTGAMTSSPGLASALETANVHATEVSSEYESATTEEKQNILDVLKLDDKYRDLTVENTKTLTAEMKNDYVNQATAQVGIGSAVGYPFGVIIVILAVNFLNVIFRFDVEEERKRYVADMEAARSISGIREIPATSFSIISFATVCFAGYVIGSVKLHMGPLGYVSLEATGGVLISALLLGYIGKIGPLSFRMDTKVLSVIRELALSFFLAVVGLNYGYGAVDAIMGSGRRVGVGKPDSGLYSGNGRLCRGKVCVQAELDYTVGSHMRRNDLHAGAGRRDGGGGKRRSRRRLWGDISVCLAGHGDIFHNFEQAAYALDIGVGLG